MKKRSNTKLVALLTAFLMVFAMMPLVAFGEDNPEGTFPEGTLSAHTHDNITFSEWTGTTPLPDTSGNYYLTEDVTIDRTWEVPSGETTLCLNGHGIIFTGETGSVINIGSGKTLNIIDCNSENLTHNFTVTNGLATVDDTVTGDGSFSGGYITGGNCTAQNIQYGGGIFNEGTLNMTGGTIIGNQADYSAGVDNRGTFNMSGNALVEYNKAGATGGVGNRLDNKFTMSGNATIRHNTSRSNGYGGGVTNYGDFYVSGTPVISENTMGNGVNGNVYAGRTGNYYFPIRVMGKLESGASIGVKRYDNTKGIIAVPGESYTITDSDKARFTADDARYEVNLISEGENAGKLELKDKEYNLWVGGTRVTYANRNDIPETNGTKTGKASFDPETYTLTLDNYTYTGAGFRTSGIFDSNDENSDIKLTILLKGINTITASKDSYAGIGELHECQGIRVDRPLEIKGSNSDQLNLHAKGVTNNNKHARGLYVVRGDLTISGGIVNAVAYACEFYCGGIYVENGNAYINGGTVIGKGDSVAGESIGIETKRTKELCIGKDVQAVTAIGATRAMGGMVKNETPGKGWTNVDGTGEAAPIEKYSGTGDGYIFNDVPYSTYKKVLFEPVHEHSFTYAAGTCDNANKITATCEGNLDCPEGYKTNGITITLNGPADLTYDGTAKAATIDDSGYPSTAVAGLADKPSVIKYYKSEGAGSTTVSGDQLTGAPAGVGDYVAQMTWGDATASVPFSIAKAPLTITALDQTYIYDGQIHGEGDPVYDDPSVIAEKVTVNRLQGSDQLESVVLNGTATEIGEYSIDVSNAVIKNGNTDVTDDYAITYVPGKLIIKSKDPSKASGTPVTKMTSGKTSMTLAWEKTAGVDGYDIFFSRCNHGSKKVALKNVKTIKGNNTFVWKNSGLKKGTCYKAYVKAYIMTSSGKKYVKSCPLMHAYTGKGTKKYTNAKSVKVNKKNVSVKVGKTFKLKAKVKKLKKNKKLMPKSHVATVRYLSTDTSIATVSSKGKIKGVRKGTCYVYAYAHNGVYKKVKVTVK